MAREKIIKKEARNEVIFGKGMYHTVQYDTHSLLRKNCVTIVIFFLKKNYSEETFFFVLLSYHDI